MGQACNDISLDKFPQAISLVLEKIEHLQNEVGRLNMKLEKEDEKILSPAQACKLFEPAISIRTLSNWSDRGLIRKHYLGGRTFYKRSEILESLDRLRKYQQKSEPH